MSEIHKSYRIRTDIGVNTSGHYLTIDTQLLQEYDTFEILSLKIDSTDVYKLHNANYGVVVGRVLANNGFGVPNAKVSIFVPVDYEETPEVKEIYPYLNTASKDKDGYRYNLLPDDKVADCHQIVGTFPNKRYALDNDVVIEAFDKYYKYTVRTNNSGDYLIMGVPVGSHILHMDLDLSDCGVLSQRPRDFVYKGYTIDQFENPNQFKKGQNYNQLTQIFTQDQVINVQPFWGNSSTGENIGITRADVNVAYTFEPTCVFLGSVISDNSSQGISKKCIPTEHMGFMEEMVTGEGTIEMIRKTPSGGVEEFQVKGTQVINGDGIWCYQIPMNLDYMMTDEYGNMVPTDDPSKGIATRTQVRFRISMQDNEENVDNYFRAKVLVPHNPQYTSDYKVEKYDYEFGSATRDESYRDLFWNNVYSVKSYIPRFQKRKSGGWKEKKFTGFKSCNFHGSNNPMPYNNMRIDLPFAFTIMCTLIKVFVSAVKIINYVINILGKVLCFLSDMSIGKDNRKDVHEKARELTLITISDGLCPDLDNWYFAPVKGGDKNNKNIFTPKRGKEAPFNSGPDYDLLKQTLDFAMSEDGSDPIDPESVSNANEGDDETVCLTVYTDYLISCIEMNLAMEYKVINFDFYNDWVNGTIYFPRFMRYVRPKKTFLGITFARTKVKGCMDNTQIFKNTRSFTQQCAIGYKEQNNDGDYTITKVDNTVLNKGNLAVKKANKMHKSNGLKRQKVFGDNGGICHEHTTLKNQHVYYMKPCESIVITKEGERKFERKINLFATDIILLGSLNECDLNGVPQAFKFLNGTSYILPTNLALTNMENNGPIYTTPAGVICSKETQLLTDSENVNTNRVAVTKPSLSDELKAFSGTGNSDYFSPYDNEISDSIAVTEAAGIAWNYTGPGQGKINENYMYYPGGHFLGMACNNAQSNIKSCLNLSRICEVGVNMSQRKEDIVSIGENGEVTYAYTVPSGFISANDIVSHDFRSMFATMNNKPLRATKTNYLTGYKIYDFDFLGPRGFEGAFNDFVKWYNNPYNENKEVVKEKLDEFGIIDDGSYGIESANTQTRTVEKTYLEYYLFRMGLTYSDVNGKGKIEQRRKFINEDTENKTTVYYLPQYENSYYFYFGLKNGATAIDEFNKQFFSVCENTLLIGSEPSISIGLLDEINVCERTADISVSISNMATPYRRFTCENAATGEITNITDTNKLNSYYMEFFDVPFGEYIFTVIDDNNTEISKNITIGEDVYTIAYDVRHFNTPDEQKVGNSTPIERGGYVTINELNIVGIPDETPIKVNLLDENDEPTNSLERYDFRGNDIFVFKSGHYKLQVEYQCSGSPKQQIILSEFDIKNNSNLGLRIGETDVFLNNVDHSPNTKWWENISGSEDYIYRHSLFNQIKKDDYGYETFSTNLIAEGGEKILWGLAQNSSGVTDKVSCSEDLTEAGYLLDDDYIYFPTYMSVSGNELQYYTATVVDKTENMVMGTYTAWLSRGNVIGEPLPKGCGYVFKPLPDGDLEYYISTGSGYTHSGNYSRGIFYPTVAFPIFNRPFYTSARLYVWTDTQVSGTTLDGDVKTALVMDVEVAGKAEMTVYNGVTYNNEFSRSSYVENIRLPILKVDEENHDLSGIMESVPREVFFSGYCAGEIDKYYYGVDRFEYKIVGGNERFDNSDTIVKTISASTEFNFADYATYSKSIIFSGDVGTRYTLNVGFYESGSTILVDDNTIYYLCCQATGTPIMPTDGLIVKNSNLIGESKDKYLYTSGGAGILVACAYKSDISAYNSGYALLSIIILSNIGELDQIGDNDFIIDSGGQLTPLGYDNIEDGVVDKDPVWGDENLGGDDNTNTEKQDEIKISFSYNYRNASGETVTEKGAIEYTGDKKDIKTMIDKALAQCNHIEGIIKYTVIDDVSNGGAIPLPQFSWKECIRQHKMNYINSGHTSGSILYAVGVKSDAVLKRGGEYTHNEFSEDAENTIFKIYPNIQEVSKKIHVFNGINGSFNGTIIKPTQKL
jgi:hypothetical protein